MRNLVLAITVLAALTVPAAANKYLDMLMGQSAAQEYAVPSGFVVVSESPEGLPKVIVRVSDIETILYRRGIYMRSGRSLPSNLPLSEILRRIRQAQ